MMDGQSTILLMEVPNLYPSVNFGDCIFNGFPFFKKIRNLLHGARFPPS